MKKFGIKSKFYKEVKEEIPSFSFFYTSYLEKLNQGEIKSLIQKNLQHVLVDVSNHNNFKKGDIVVCCDKQYESLHENNQGGAGWQQGVIFTIANLTDDVAWATRSDKIKWGYGVYFNYLRYATEQEIKNYKNRW